MSDHFRTLAAPPPEQQAICAKCFHLSGTFVEFKKEEIEQSIPARFEKQVAQYPDRIAIKTKNSMLTYDELNRAANRIAWAILQKCGQGEKPIALLLENNVLMVAAILGAWKAGKFYVPLDPSHPHDRIDYFLEDSQSALLLTNNRNLRLADDLAQNIAQWINLEEIDGISTDNVSLPLSPDGLAYILYTSGSTGQPKGVVQNHRNLLQSVRTYTNSLHICPQDRLLPLSTPSHFAGISDLLRGLLNGAGVFPFHVDEEGLSHLGDWMVQEEITLYHSVPTTFRHFVEALRDGTEFPKLRLVHLGGEPVSTRDVELFKKHFSPDCVLLNNLSGTETSSYRQYFLDTQTPIKSGTVPAGYAVEDSEVLLLDDDGQPAAPGDIGEIAVKSRYLFLEYWRRPELTRAAFLPNTEGGDQRIYRTGDLGQMLPDGCLILVGRKDFRVKIRGYRIETGEIEMALLSHPIVKEAVVIAQASGEQEDEQRLVAYVVYKTEERPTGRDWRTFLRKTLPEHMIPAAFVTLDALPLTPNGKVDRKALPDPDSVVVEGGEEYVAPRTPMERVMAEVWQEVLGVNRVGVHDNFFDLGGHSLLSAKVTALIEEKTGLRTYPREMVYQTLAQVAATCEQQGAAFPSHSIKGVGGRLLHLMRRRLYRWLRNSTDEARLSLPTKGVTNARAKL